MASPDAGLGCVGCRCLASSNDVCPQSRKEFQCEKQVACVAINVIQRVTKAQLFAMGAVPSLVDCVSLEIPGADPHSRGK